MTNHVHLLITLHIKGGIGKVMQMVGRYYVQYFNDQYDRTGTLWEGRYKATVLNSEQYLLACSRYIELNPVCVGMVKHLVDHPWSSYHFNALGIDTYEIKITAHSVYTALDKNASKRRVAYRNLFEHQIPESTIDKIRAATNKAWVLGNDKFQQQIELLSQRQAKPRPRGRDKRSEKVRNLKINRV